MLLEVDFSCFEQLTFKLSSFPSVIFPHQKDFFCWRLCKLHITGWERKREGIIGCKPIVLFIDELTPSRSCISVKAH